MDFFFDDHLIVNGKPVHARDMHHDGGPDSHLPHVQRDDEDDVATDCSDVGEISESENEDHKGVIGKFRKIHSRDNFPFPFLHTPLKNPMNEGDDPLANHSKGKGKVRERTATPEPQNQAQDTDLLHFLIGTMEKKRYSPYAGIDHEPRVKSIRGPPIDYEDFGDSDFVSSKRYRRHDMFASRFMPFRTRSRRPLPEFVTGPSRITLDDLY